LGIFSTGTEKGDITGVSGIGEEGRWVKGARIGLILVGYHPVVRIPIKSL